MIKTLSRVGNSQALILDKTVLELIGVDARGEVEMHVEGDALVVRPVGKRSRQQRLRTLSKEIMDRHDEAFRKLSKP